MNFKSKHAVLISLTGLDMFILCGDENRDRFTKKNNNNKGVGRGQLNIKMNQDPIIFYYAF
jgi:hypothetical protein